MRTAASAFFVLFALVLGAVALPSAWLAFNVVAEDGFVELAAPLADDAEFTGALAETMSEEAAAGVELPFGMTDMVQPLLRDVMEGITQQPEFDEAWQETLRRSHALNFTDEGQPPSESGSSPLFIFDVAPLVELMTAEIGGQLGVDVPASEQTLLEVGDTDQFDVVDRAETAAELWPALTIASAVGALLALALARRRSTTLAFLGLGVLLVGAGWWLAAGFAPDLVNQGTGDVAVADTFRDVFIARAVSDFQEWCLAVLAAGILLMVAGIVGRLLIGSRK